MPAEFYTDQDSIDIVFDSGCTTTMNPFKEDCFGEITPVIKSMRGLGATYKVTGEKYVEWKFRDDYGVKQKIKVKELLVPSSRVRLFSPQDYFEQE